MRISDWSSDVCSSDLSATQGAHQVAQKFTSTTRPRKSGRLAAAPSSAWKATLGAGTGGSEKVKFPANGPSGAEGVPPDAASRPAANAGETDASSSAASPTAARVFLMTTTLVSPNVSSMVAERPLKDA